MADAFIGEIRAFAFDYPPQGWAFCGGNKVPIQQNTALYAVIGNNFGPSDSVNFILPNMQGQAPMHWGNSGIINSDIGDTMGTAEVTLLSQEMPIHNHQANAASPPSPIPAGMLTSAPSSTSYLSIPRGGNVVYDAWSTVTSTPTASMALNMISPAGGSQPHNNLSPYLALNFCICLEGEFPARPS